MAGSAPHIPGCRDLSLIGERVARSLFSAWSDAAGRPVTVTVFPPLSEGRTRAGFDQAAATAQRLGAHPSVLTIHGWGHAPDGRPWIVTDPQPPESVDTLLTMDGPLEVERALQVGVLLAGALETAHRAGIVHGDLQPDRLVFGSHGEPLLVETGLAAFAVFPGLGALNNPVRYHAPPEVLERTEVTPATDVYSLATTVYALLAARAPHQKPAEVTDSNASLLLRILQMSVPPIGRRDLPPGLEDALRGPLSANPSKRPQQAIEVAWLLQDVQRRAGLPVTEPVVLDLDDLGAGAPGPLAPPDAAATGLPAGPRPDVEAEIEQLYASSRRSSAGDDPSALPLADLGGLGGAAGAGLAAADDEVLPPPTIFPFAEGREHEGAAGLAEPPADPWAVPGTGAGAGADDLMWAAPAEAPPDSPWSGLAGRDAAEALWSAPADADAVDAPWAAPPAETDDRETSPWAPPAGPADDADSPWARAADTAAAPSPWAPPADDAPGAPWATPAPDDPAPGAAGPPWSDATDHAAPSPWAPTTPDAAADHTAASPWADPAADADSPPTLWPSTWPAEGAGDEPPAWAVPPASDQADLPARPPARGDDGGSIADSGPLGAGGRGGDPPPPTVTSLPAELEELPAWYTDPLPNERESPGNGHGLPGRPPSNGHGPAPGSWTGPAAAEPGRGVAPTGPDPRPSDAPPGSFPTAPPDAAPSPWDTGWAAPAAPPPSDARGLPGAGDELRSLFGEVVGDPATPPPLEARRPSAFDDDPLGPPESRPPIDLGQLDRPLGPTPYLPSGRARADGDPAEAGRPARLPRRHEPQTWPSPAAEVTTGPPTRLPRADEVDPSRRPTRPGPRQVAPAAGQRPGPALRPSASAGPPALPVVILVAVVVVLALGVAWLVLTGDDEGSPATDRRDPPASEGAPDDPAGSSADASSTASPSASPAGAPSGLRVDELPEGVQVSWSGPDDASYVVTVLSADAPPSALPATIGTSALVPNVEGAADGGRCFTVAAAGADGETGPPSGPVCTPGASAGDMVQG